MCPKETGGGEGGLGGRRGKASMALQGQQQPPLARTSDCGGWGWGAPPATCFQLVGCLVLSSLSVEGEQRWGCVFPY